MASAQRDDSNGTARWRRMSGSSSQRSARDPVSHAERVAAAQARVSADKKRGVTTAEWIVRLAQEG